MICFFILDPVLEIDLDLLFVFVNLSNSKVN